MNGPDDAILRILSEVKAKAAQDAAAREAILANPAGVLREHGLNLRAETHVIAEYYDGYGLFIAFPLMDQEGATASNADTTSTLLDHPSDDCLHY